jgi:hypothetical protein
MESEYGFTVKYIYLGYIAPQKDSNEEISILSKNLDIQESDPTSKYLLKIFDKALNECRIKIQFISDDLQHNEFRENLLKLMRAKDLESKKEISDQFAEKMAKLTDERMGNGLLMIVQGEKGNTTRLVISRFKSEEMIFTKILKGDLKIDFIKEAFSKKTREYKSVLFEDVISNRSFWTGFAVDKQSSADGVRDLSDYWVEDFLTAKSVINDIQGTVYLARTLKNLIKSIEDVDQQQAIIDSIITIHSRGDGDISINEYANSYLPLELREIIKKEVNDDHYFNSRFTIDTETFNTQLGYKTVILQNGVRIFIPTFDQTNMVIEEQLDDLRTKFTVVDRVIERKLNKKQRVKQK